MGSLGYTARALVTAAEMASAGVAAAMSQRFFCPDFPDAGGTVLEGPEFHHLRVSRWKVGEEIWLFDGKGREARCRIRHLGRHAAELEIVEARLRSTALPGNLILCASAPEGERLHWLVEKATELGVGTLAFIVAARTPPAGRTVRREKLLRWVVEACKQCGRNELMTVSAPAPWTHVLRSVTPSGYRYLCERGFVLLWKALPAPVPAGASIALAIGPEGGWEEQELRAAMEAGWQPVGLGPGILRIETAAVAAAAVARAWLLDSNQTNPSQENLTEQF
jgi:16S rRNA (uracil1498-N3)-methyltransferase